MSKPPYPYNELKAILDQMDKTIVKTEDILNDQRLMRQAIYELLIIDP